MSKFLDKTGLDTFWAKIKSTFQTLGNLVTSIRASSSASDDKYPSEKAVASAIESLDVSSVGGNGKYISSISETDGKISATATTMDTTPTASSQKAVTSGGVKSALDDKNWFKNKGPSYLQNSNAYYQCISVATNDFSGLVKLYDVTEFFDGTIVNQNERSVFFGDVSLIRDGGVAGCKYARVCAMIGYSNADSNIILQSDDDNAYPLLVKEDFDRLTPPSEIGAYVISNGTATLDTSVTRSRYFTVDCSSYSRMFINAGFYNPSGYGLGSIKAYIFVNDSNVVLGNADGTNFDGYVDVPSGATKLYLHTNNGYSQVSVGPTTNSPRYFLAMRYVAGWPAGTIEYFGRFYTRTTDSASYSARPLLLTYVQNLAPVGTTYIPSGYVVVKSAKYTTHSAVSDKLATARKLKTNLARTADSKFDGSADQENIPVTGTLPIGNGGTGQTTAQNVVRETIQSGIVDKATATTDVSDATEIITTHATSGYTSSTKDLYRRPATKLWNYIKDKISSVLGLSTTGYTGNAATASAAKSGSDLETAINGKAPTNHASSSDTYGKGTTSNYGHVKLATGDMNGASNADGVACSKNHTHSQYLTSHQDISGKMATSGSNATSAAGGNIIRAMTNWTNINDDEVFPAASASSQGKYSFSRLWAWIKGKGLAGFDTNAFSPSDETTRAYRRLVLGKTTVLPSSDPVLVMASCIIKVHVNYKTDNANGMSLTMLASIAYRTASYAEMRLDVIGSARWKFDQLFPNLVSFPITEDGGTKNVICLAFTSGMTGTSLQTLLYSYVDIIPVGRVNGFTWMDTGDNQDSYSYIARCVRKLEPDGDNNRGLMLVNNSVEAWLSAGYDSNNKVYIDSTSNKNGVYVKNGGSGKWMCYSDRSGNCKFEGDADTIDGYHIRVGSYSSSTNTISFY